MLAQDFDINNIPELEKYADGSTISLPVSYELDEAEDYVKEHGGVIYAWQSAEEEIHRLSRCLTVPYIFCYVVTPIDIGEDHELPQNEPEEDEASEYDKYNDYDDDEYEDEDD